MKFFFTLLLMLSLSIASFGQIEDTIRVDLLLLLPSTQLEPSKTSARLKFAEKDFNDGNINDIMQLIQGQTPGLTIAKPGGDPMQLADLRVRGVSSIIGKNAPLFVIDGIPAFDLLGIDPQDIATIEIIKDAGTAAIWGTRASGGVVNITTKTGEEGKAKVSYDAYFANEQIANQLPFSDAAYYNENVIARGSGVLFSGNTDWLEATTRQANSHAHNLAFSGGTNATTYRIGLNYRDIQGVLRENEFDQMSMNLNFSQKALGDRLFFQIRYNNARRRYQANEPNIFRYIRNYNPTAPILDNSTDDFGGYFEAPFFDFFNPVSIIEQQINEGVYKTANFNGLARVNILWGLDLSVQYGLQSIDESYGFYAPRTLFHQGYLRGGLARRSWQGVQNEFFETKINYSKNLNRSIINATLGYAYQDITNENFFAEAGNFISDAFSYNRLQFSEDLNTGDGFMSSYKENQKLASFFSQVRYTYASKLFANISVRRDGSSRFGGNSRWGMFWGVTAGADLARMIKMTKAQQLILRAGYGNTGGLPAINNAFLQVFAPFSNVFQNGTFVQGFAPTTNPNPNLKWEENNELNLGFDFSVLNGQISGSFDYFSAMAQDLIFRVRVPSPPNIATQTILNRGSISSSGVELNFNFKVIDSEKLKWTIGTNLSTFSSRLEELFDGDDEALYLGTFSGPGFGNEFYSVAAEGQPLGRYWGLEYENISQDGFWEFRDVDNNGTIDFEDRIIIGNSTPDIIFGLRNQLKFNRLDIDVLFRGAAGHQIANLNRLFYENNFPFAYNVLTTTFEAERLRLQEFNQWSSYFVENASFLRLAYITVGYEFGQKGCKCYVYATATNVFTITGYQGIDPEVRLSNDQPLAAGVELREIYSPVRGILIGVRTSF